MNRLSVQPTFQSRNYKADVLKNNEIKKAFQAQADNYLSQFTINQLKQISEQLQKKINSEINEQIEQIGQTIQETIEQTDPQNTLEQEVQTEQPQPQPEPQPQKKKGGCCLIF